MADITRLQDVFVAMKSFFMVDLDKNFLVALKKAKSTNLIFRNVKNHSEAVFCLR